MMGSCEKDATLDEDATLEKAPNALRSNWLAFSAAVTAGCDDTDGVNIVAGGIGLDGGTITDQAGNAAVLTILSSPTTADSQHKLDATAPTKDSTTITSDPKTGQTAYGEGEAIDITV